MSSLATRSGVVEHVDRDRAVADDGEGQARERLLLVERDDAGGAVHQRRAKVGSEAPGRHRPSRDPRDAVQLEGSVAAAGAFGELPEVRGSVDDRLKNLAELKGAQMIGC